MIGKKSVPGVSRENRLSDEGLRRLDDQLTRGVKLTVPVMAQWINRYGDPAREIIKRHGQYCQELDSVS